LSRDPFYLTQTWLRLRAACLEHDPVCRTPGCGRKATHAATASSNGSSGPARSRRSGFRTAAEAQGRRVPVWSSRTPRQQLVLDRTEHAGILPSGRKPTTLTDHPEPFSDVQVIDGGTSEVIIEAASILGNG